MRTLGHLNGDGPLLERLRWKNLNVPQKIALAAVGAGYLLGSLNRSVAGEDDDGVNWYDKVPYHVKERNLVIMKSMFGAGPESTGVFLCLTGTTFSSCSGIPLKVWLLVT